ncbi:MAG: hypothetical protein ACT4PP_08625 [Sporichthyaceae bacterium]
MTATPNSRRWGSLVALGAVILALTSACGPGDGSALRPSRPTTTFIGPPITEKNPTFHQTFMIDHPGAQITVLEVTALTSPNVTHLGSVAVWPRDLKGPIGGGPGFPPPGIRGHHALDEVIPAAETLFEPAGYDEPAAVGIAVGFRLNGTGVGAVNGVRLVYEVDDKRIVDVQRVAIIACLRPKAKDCDGPRFLDDPDFADKTLRRYGLLPEES